jgi:competence protein ComEA
VTEGPTRAQLALYVAAAIAIALLGARYLRGEGEPAAPAAASPAAVQVGQRRASAATVHVAGAVRRPGVYRMRPGSRIDDAVRRAGGATAKADLGAVNLAAKIEDGRQVLVPERAPAPAAAAAASPGSPAAATPPGAPLSLNTATVGQLDTLPGVGPATAEKIIAYREEHGGFGSVEELGQVPGIGEKRLAALRDLVQA